MFETLSPFTRTSWTQAQHNPNCSFSKY